MALAVARTSLKVFVVMFVVVSKVFVVVVSGVFVVVSLSVLVVFTPAVAGKGAVA